jgi:hypothetical protein
MNNIGQVTEEENDKHDPSACEQPSIDASATTNRPTRRKL